MAIREIRLPDGTNLKIDEWIHWPSFSTIEFAAYSKINLRAFSYIAGQQVPSEGLTKRTADDADTNSTVRNRTRRILEKGSLTNDDRTWLTRMSQLLLLSVF